TAARPIWVCSNSWPATVVERRSRSLRQGANSASTAKVTRMRIGQLGGSLSGDLLGAAGFDVAVGLVPLYGSVEGGGDGSGLEAEFALCARGIDKHHVAGNLY